MAATTSSRRTPTAETLVRGTTAHLTHSGRLSRNRDRLTRALRPARRAEEFVKRGAAVGVGEDEYVVVRSQDGVAARCQQVAVPDHQADPDLLAARQFVDGAAVGGRAGRHVVA